MFMLDLLTFLFFAIIVSFFLPKNNTALLRDFSLFVFCVSFLYSLLLIFFTNLYESFLQVSVFEVLVANNFYYFLGIDSISSFFILLTSFLFVLCVLSSFSSIKFNYKAFVITTLLLDFFLINLFSALDLFFFYIFFESILVPMFLLIGIWGSRQRRIHAGVQFFFYTLFGSFFMLAGLVILYSHAHTTNVALLVVSSISNERQLLIWICFFIAFAIKIPMFPFHIWLPEAHVEAPTVGSVLLAGILLKLGGYGFLRFMLPLLPYANFYYTPFVFTIATVAVLYTSLTAIRQVDLKKIIAYASVSHMNFVVLGLFTSNVVGLLGSIFLMLSHGIVSSGLFFSVGVVYDRYHTRLLKYYGGLVYSMPVYAIAFFVLILANFSFPGTSNFVGEFMVLAGLIFQNPLCVFFSLISIVFSVVYSVWSYNRFFFGFVNSQMLHFADMSKREFSILGILALLALLFGICPSSVLNKLEWASLDLFLLRAY